MLHLFARLMSLLVKWATYIIEDVNVTSLHRNVTSHIETSGSFRQIYVNEYGIDRPVSRGRELAVLAACTAGPHGLWADLHLSSLVDLRRQADAAQQLLIARIGTEAVECGVHFQK